MDIQLVEHIAGNRATPATPGLDVQQSIAHLLLSTQPVAAMLIDTDGSLVQANLAGRKLIELADGLEREGSGRVVASVKGDNSRLRKALSVFATDLAADERAGSTPPLWLQRTSGHPPLLLVFDAVPQLKFPHLTRKPLVLLRVLNEEQELGGRLHLVRAAFSLTLAETRVAEQVAAGRSPREAAEHLDLSRNTVRTHLARIFDKTGVRSQHALVRLVMALSSWPVA